MSKKVSIVLILIIFILRFVTYTLANATNEDITEASSEPKLERHFVFDVIPLNLKEIEQLSGRIFSGVCVSSEEIEDDPESKLPVVKYAFKITEGIKGVDGLEEITFKQWLPTTRTNGYEIGKKYILFLYPNSEIGLTSTVGVEQGNFEVERKGLIRKNEVVHNKSGNRGLSRNLRTQKVLSIEQDKFINDYVQECSELGIPMRYKEFVKAIRYLTEKEE